MIRTDMNGDTIRTKRFGNTSDDWLESIVYASDKFIVVSGQDGFPNDAVQRGILAETDLNGKIFNLSYRRSLVFIQYDRSGYFTKANQVDENTINISKVPFNGLFTDETGR